MPASTRCRAWAARPADERRGTGRPDAAAAASRPPRAVVGSQVDTEELIFADFDGRILRRFWGFISPYRRQLAFAIAAVLAFAASQIAIPLILRAVVDDALVDDGGMVLDQRERLLLLGVLVFLGIVSLSFIANLVQETLAARIGERLLFDLRRAMFAHLQRVSLSFMDKTEVGRLMSRLQGDVNALQEFLETSVFAVGDFVLLVGITVVLLVLDWRLALLTLSVMLVLLVVRIVWLPKARQAFLRARVTSSTLNGALAEGINGVRTVQGMGREAVNLRLFEEKAARQSRRPAARHLARPDHGADRRHADRRGHGDRRHRRRHRRARGRARARRHGRLHLLRAALLRPDPLADHAVQRHAAGHGLGPADLRGDGRAGRRRGQARCPRPGDASTARSSSRMSPSATCQASRCSMASASRLEPGETVALVGPTGSGKSSTMALVHRFYDVWDGRGAVGGHDVRDLTQASLGRHIAMVLQEPFLFTGTVLENIRYATTGAVARERRGRGARGRRARLHHARCRRATTPSSSSRAAICRSASAS